MRRHGDPGDANLTLMSPLVPARCLDCGRAIRGDGGIMIEGAASNITISDSTIDCPHCGGRAQFLEGTFNVREGGFEMLSGPQWSWDLVEQVRLTLRRVVDEMPVDPDAAVAAASPELAGQVGAVTTGWSRSDKIALYALLLTLLTASYDNVTTVGAAVGALIQHVAETGRLPGS